MLKIYNSLTDQIETFVPIHKKRVNIYVCGPTVYGDIHIGNARPIIFFDVLKNYLKVLNYDVRLVSNVTDVDDKIIDRALDLKIKESELSKRYEEAFIHMTLLLGSNLPDQMPKATEYVVQMIEYIQELIDLGFAYQTDTGVYFRVTKVKDYGTLSNQKMDALNEGVRVTLSDDKEDPRDFTLWKRTTIGLNFESPWGAGRPGWHTECAVMNHEIFHSEIDIHGGGSDLKFPHHENEIAQTCAHDNHHLARYWMHVGRLNMSGTKMSKSLGNIVLVKDLLDIYDPLAFRLLILSHHYRQPISYSTDLMNQFAREYDKIKRTLKKAYLSLSLAGVQSKMVDDDLLQSFMTYMNQDFNTPNVMTLIYDVLKRLNKTNDSNQRAIYYQTLKQMLDVLGIMPKFELRDDVLSMYRQWETARSEKNFQLADQLRSKLTEQGWL